MSVAGASARKGSFGTGLRTRPKAWTLLLGALVGLLIWELSAQTLGKASPQAAQILPSLWIVVREGFTALSAFGPLADAHPNSVPGALAALGSNGAITLWRVTLGLVIGAGLGVVLGLLVSGLRPLRHGVTGVAELMRMLPTLAMAPLFTLWFGATTSASVVFIVFAVTFVVLVGMTNAVRNVPPEVLEYPRTLGVGKVRLLVRVVLPAVLPEIRGPLMFAGLVAWTTSLASELYGIQSGLGWMLGQTLRFSLVDQMVVVAVIFSGLALVTMRLLGLLVTRLTAWND